MMEIEVIIKHIFEDGEINEKAVVRKFRITASNGKDCLLFSKRERKGENKNAYLV